MQFISAAGVVTLTATFIGFVSYANGHFDDRYDARYATKRDTVADLALVRAVSVSNTDRIKALEDRMNQNDVLLARVTTMLDNLDKGQTKIFVSLEKLNDRFIQRAQSSSNP